MVEGVTGRLHEETHENGRALRGWEAPQPGRTGLLGLAGQDVLAVGVEPGQVEGQHAGGPDLVQRGGEAQECTSRRDAGRFFEGVQGGYGPLGLHGEKRVQPGGHLRGHQGQEARGNLLAGAFALLAHQPSQGRGGREENLLVAQKGLRLAQEGGGVREAGRFFQQKVAQSLPFGGPARPDSEMALEQVLVFGHGGTARGVVLEQTRVDAESMSDKGHHPLQAFQRLLVGEAAGEAEKAQLIRQPQAVMRAPTAGQEGLVGRGEMDAFSNDRCGIMQCLQQTRASLSRDVFRSPTLQEALRRPLPAQAPSRGGRGALGGKLRKNLANS